MSRTTSHKQSNRELHFLRVWEMRVGSGFPPTKQYRYALPERQFRFDFCWIPQRVAVEIEGGVFMRGKSGHTSMGGVQKDCEKGNAAVLRGWRVLRYTTKDLQSRPVQIVDEILWLLKAITEARSLEPQLVQKQLSLTVDNDF